MLNALKNVFGNSNDRFIKSLNPLVEKINNLEESMIAKSDAELKALTETYKKRVADGETLDQLLPEAFATVREASKRSMGMRHFDVQLIGGIILHRGMVTEMKTGEGKTLVATLPAYLNALTGKGVHVVTVNDYLAKRDAEWMANVFNFLGMTCLSVTNDLSPAARKESYACDITYATNNELGFDYLRDNMAFTEEQLVQREPNYAIVDEVDSILIDEARTPLIISGPTEDKTDMYQTMDSIMPQFERDTDYEVDEKQKSAALTDAGMDKAEDILKEKGLVEEGHNLYEMHYVGLVHHLNQALRAHALFQKDVDYIIHNKEVVIIDEFTGRMMPGRRFSDGLHQALEAREGVDIKNENQTLASITFQNYFRLYNKLSGMTGTAETEAEELQTIYGLSVAVVPTNVEVARDDEADIIYRSVDEKNDAIVADIKDCHERGQPTLVGTTSIEKSEELSKVLKKAKVKHQVLNARHHEQESEIVAQAGRLGAVTIATNMAGRGTDIKLGGNLEMLLEGVTDKSEIAKITKQHEEENKAVMDAGGLRVIGTERHESRRIDNQLRGRSGRQGDVGSSTFYLSLQDDLMRIFGGALLERVAEGIGLEEGEAIQNKMISKSLETSQRKIEGRNFDIRKHLLKFDDVLNEQRKVIYAQRREIMTSETVDDIILDFREDALEMAHESCFPQGSYEDQWLVDAYHEEMKRLFNVTPNIKGWIEESSNTDDILEKSRALMQSVWSEKEKRLGVDTMRALEKAMLLQVLDQQWKDHLQRLDYLKQGINLRGYGQKDPVNEYKREAFEMFEELMANVRNDSVSFLSRVEVTEEEVAQMKARQEGAELPGQASDVPDDYDPYADMMLSRNAPCPCGSGRKYKHCHGKLPAKQSA